MVSLQDDSHVKQTAYEIPNPPSAFAVSATALEPYELQFAILTRSIESNFCCRFLSSLFLAVFLQPILIFVTYTSLIPKLSQYSPVFCHYYDRSRVSFDRTVIVVRCICT